MLLAVGQRTENRLLGENNVLKPYGSSMINLVLQA